MPFLHADLTATTHLLSRLLLKPPVNESEHSRTTGGELNRLRDELLPQGQLDVQALTRQLWQLRQMWRTLMPSNWIYPYAEYSVPAPNGGTPPIKYSVVKPLDLAKAHLANYYAAKYGIQILPRAMPRPGESWLQFLNRTANWASGKALGLVLRGLRDPMYCPSLNYENHVVPVLIQQDGDWINLVSLDALGELSPGFNALCQGLKADGLSVRIAVPTLCRQADEQSCHTDAMQVLKDVLVRHQSSGCHSIWQFLHNEHALSSETSASLEQQLDWPVWLHKTTQCSKALPEGPLGTAMALHRKKYMAMFPARGAAQSTKPANQFLLVKAVRNTKRLLDDLKAISTSSERQSWLVALQRKYGLTAV